MPNSMYFLKVTELTMFNNEQLSSKMFTLIS